MFVKVFRAIPFYFVGASLAQDRGSLEAKLEAQKHEISMLKKQLEVNDFT